jgi:hypothetical protein
VSEGAGNRLAGDNYTELQRVRGYASDAIGRLRKYDPDAPPALRGEMYALAGYAEIMLADLYCSGVPLSTLDFEADYTDQAGSTTARVYEHALGLLDTAVTLGADSARVVTLARVGRGRALLALGRYDDAAEAVKDVQLGDVYQFPVAWQGVDAVAVPAFNLATVADNEGVNGLPYISSGDPRTTVVANGTNSFHIALWFPAKYGSPMATSAVTVADWIEAALIRAEADMHGTGSNWLAILNTLRTTGTYTDVDTVVVSVDNTVTPPDTTFRYDTAWVAGTGGVAGLGPLTDPGSDTARVSLLFRERAFWLFATGHRQGDLRRLIRQYDRTQTTTYPRGPYTGVGVYGQDVTLPIPEEERTNPLFTGCIDRNA